MPFPSVGVVIPNYERVESLIKAVESVQNQNYPNIEIVIVDDGSAPESLQEIEKRLNGVPIKIIRESRTNNPGLMRQIGVAYLNTEWVAFLDSDDLWNQGKLSKQIEFAESKKAEFVSTNAIVLNENGETRRYFTKLPLKINLRQLVVRNYVVTSSVIVKREVLVSVGNFSSSYHVRGVEDYSTWLRVATKTPIFLMDEVMITYAENSKDSISKDGEYIQYYNHLFAIIDFLSWKNATQKSLSVKEKVTLRLFRLILSWIEK
jgi:teichuronic acid biosynthesis glycosyltransferase TuaG